MPNPEQSQANFYIFRPEFVKVAGSANAALFLSVCFHWTNCYEERGGWFYKTASSWMGDTGLTRRELESAREILSKMGVIEEKRAGLKGVLHYRVNLEVLQSLLCPSPVCTNPPFLNVQNVQSEEVCLYKTYIPVCTNPPFLNVQNVQSLYMESNYTKEDTKEREEDAPAPSVIELSRPGETEGFTETADLYPVKSGREDARKYWVRHHIEANLALRAQIKRAVVAQVAAGERFKDELHWWLRNRRFDYVPAASSVAAVVAVAPARGSPPIRESVSARVGREMAEKAALKAKNGTGGGV